MKNLVITGHHLEITEALRDFIGKKFKKLERHFDHITQSHVFMSVDQGEHTVEAKLHIPNHEIFAQQKSTDMYEAIDLLVGKLDRQLIKQKEKMKNHHPHPKNAMSFRDEEE